MFGRLVARCSPCGLFGRTVLAVSLLVAAALACASERRELHVFTWSDYVDPTLVSLFEKQHDVRVRFSYFASDEQRDRELAASDGKGYDLIMMSDTRIGNAGRHGWLAPIDRTRVPQAVHVDERWANAVAGASTYGVPWLWGTLGIGWREDLTTRPIAHWRDLFEPAPELDHHIAMSDDPRELVAVALKSAGRSGNSSAHGALDEAARRLLDQRVHVRNYGYPTMSTRSTLASGDVVAAMMYSGDVLTLQEHTPSIRYTLPEEGGFIWVDYLAVAAASRNKNLAHAYINFMNRPANAAQLSAHLHYATANRAAWPLLPAQLRADPIVYPDESALTSAEFLEPLAPHAKRLINGVRAALIRP